MKTVLSCLLLAAIAFIGFAQSEKYSNPKFGFSIDLPSGWQVTEPGIEKTGSVTNNFAVRATHAGAVINVAVDDWYTNRLNDDQRKTMTRGDIDAYWNNEKSINDIADPTVQTLTKSFKEFRLLERKITDFDATKAFQMRYSAKYSVETGQEIDLTVVFRMLIKNGVQYSIGATAVGETFEKQTHLLNAVMDSFDAPFNLPDSQKANALSRKLSLWARFIVPILQKAAAQAILGGSIAAIAVAIGIVRARRAAKRNKNPG